MGKIISVTGLEGAGKSTFSANLALSLALKDKVVVLLPAFLDYGGIQLFFGDVIGGDKGILAAFSDKSGRPEKFLTQSKANKNIYILGVPNHADEPYRALFDEGVVEGVMRRLSNIADYIIVDGTAGTSNPVTYYSLSQSAMAFEIITLSSRAAMRINALRNLFALLCDDKLFYLVSEANIGCDSHKFLEEIKIEPLAYLPFVADAPDLENEATLIYSSRKGKKYKAVIDKMAQSIISAGGD